jgi:transcriptional regulator with XRE-family HTH domain
VSPTQQLGRRIVKRRKDRGWDQKTLARVAGINAGYLSSIERGLKAPSLSTLHKLRFALGLEDEVFLAWIDLLRPERSAA